LYTGRANRPKSLPTARLRLILCRPFYRSFWDAPIRRPTTPRADVFGILRPVPSSTSATTAKMLWLKPSGLLR
jgi:hypothetical protein